MPQLITVLIFGLFLALARGAVRLCLAIVRKGRRLRGGRARAAAGEADRHAAGANEGLSLKGGSAPGC